MIWRLPFSLACAAINCPHCGCVQSGLDGFCSECRGSLDESDLATDGVRLPEASTPAASRDSWTDLLERLTFPARLVILISMVGSVGGTALFASLTWESLPPGSYPTWLFGVPVLIAVALLTIGTLWFLRLCGVPIYKESHRDLDENRD